MVENPSMNSRSTTSATAIQNMPDTDSKWGLVPLAQFQFLGSWWSSMTAISHMDTSQFKYTDCSTACPDLEELTEPHNSASHSQHNQMPLILYNHFGQRLAQSVRKCYWKRSKESRKGLSNFDPIIRVSTGLVLRQLLTQDFNITETKQNSRSPERKAWSKSHVEHAVLVLPTQTETNEATDSRGSCGTRTRGAPTTAPPSTAPPSPHASLAPCSTQARATNPRKHLRGVSISGENRASKRDRGEGGQKNARVEGGSAEVRARARAREPHAAAPGAVGGPGQR